MGRRARRQRHPDPAGARARLDGRRRSFALPEYDPFWEQVQEAGILVGMHASDDGSPAT